MKIYSLLIALCLSILAPNTSHAAALKIVALVNGEIISTEDMQNQLNAFLMTTKIPLNPQTRSMILQRVMNSAIDQKIKLQAAAKEGIEISPDEIKNAMRSFEKNNQIPEGQLVNILKQANVSVDTFQEQMKADLAWLRLIRKKNFANGTLTQKEIETAYAEAQKDLNTPKYLVSEIFIKKENAKNLSALVDNLRKDSRFELYAMQFSDSPSAANGGNLGWVNEGKLASALETKLKRMKDGEISDAIMVGDGYYILKLQKNFDPKTDKQLPTQKDIKAFLENQKMDALSKKTLQELRQRAVIEIRS